MAPTSDGGEQIALCLSTMLLTFSVGGLMTSIPCKLVNIEKYAASWFFCMAYDDQDSNVCSLFSSGCF